MLAEEAAEIVQVVMKILRHGPRSGDPTKPESLSNIEELDLEMKDIIAVHIMMMQAGDLPQVPMEAVIPIIGRKLRWSHHQIDIQPAMGEMQ